MTVSRYVEDFEARLSNMRTSIENYLSIQKQTMKDLRDDFRKSALTGIKRELILKPVKRRL